FSPKKLILAAGESRQVRFNARFLPSTEKKEYRTMIYVEQISTAQTQSSGAGFLPRIGITLYVQLGDMKSDLTVTQANYKDKKLALAVTNTGQATARPRVVWNLEQAGKILVTNEGHKTAFYPTTVIAEGKRNIEIKAPELSQLTNGNYQLIGTLLWGGNKNSLKFNQAFTVTR
ncbi:MAG: hypothetical protein KAG26_07040, partial [Methylococcales bacterium]|nr:hypothetical protein [Methylococcales bacterium]